MKKLPLIALTLFTLLPIRSEELPRPVVEQYRLEGGKGTAFSSYLSPIVYSGDIIQASAEWSKALPSASESAIMRFAGSAQLTDLLNPSQTAKMTTTRANFLYGIELRKRLPYSLQATSGTSIEATAGVMYLTRNGNNPVSVIANPTFALDASLSWKFNAWKFPCLLVERLHLPSVGAFFMPEYGQTYYEIYLGERQNLAHFGWLGNNFRINNRLSLIIDCGRTAWELGYSYDYYSAKANHIFNRTTSHLLSIGVIPHGLGIKRKAAINSPLY